MNRLITLINFIFVTKGLYRLSIDGKIIYARLIPVGSGFFSTYLIEYSNIKVGSYNTKSKIMGYRSEFKIMKYILKGEMTKIC